MDKTIYPPSNVDPSTTSNTRTRPTSKNSDHYLECHTGSHSENRDKATPPKLVRKSSRQNMMRNLNHIRRSRRLLMKRNENDYIEHVKSCSGVENKTFSANLTTSKSTNVILLPILITEPGSP